MKKIFLTAVALAAFCFAGHAQEKQGNPNPWFIQGQLGMTYSTGNIGIGKLLSPGGQIAVGKYFSPVWGARVAISGWQGRGRRPVGNRASGFYYGAATLDGMMNLSQLIKKYPERLFDVSVIAGIGFNRAFEHSVSSFMGRLGLQGSFRLNDAMDFNIEALANGVSDRWNRLDDHGIDTYFTLGLGLTYKFGTGYRCPTCISEEQVYTNEQMNALINEQRATQVLVPDTVLRVDTIYVEVEGQPTKVVKGIRSYVAFAIGKTNIASN